MTVNDLCSLYPHNLVAFILKISIASSKHCAEQCVEPLWSPGSRWLIWGAGASLIALPSPHDKAFNCCAWMQTISFRLPPTSTAILFLHLFCNRRNSKVLSMGSGATGTSSTLWGGRRTASKNDWYTIYSCPSTSNYQSAYIMQLHHALSFNPHMCILVYPLWSQLAYFLYKLPHCGSSTGLLSYKYSTRVTHCLGSNLHLSWFLFWSRIPSHSPQWPSSVNYAQNVVNLLRDSFNQTVKLNRLSVMAS
jgi:hypothetical protein